MGNVLGDRLVGVSGDLGKERRVHRSRKAFALGALAPLLLVCACSGDPEPKVAPPTSPSTSVSTSPSPSGPVEPVMPDAAKAHTAAGAEAFVTFYWEMVNYAQATGDLSGLESLAAEGCAACKGGVDSLRKIFAKGGHVRGGYEVSITESHATRAGSQRGFAVSADVITKRQIVDYPGNSNDVVRSGAKSPLLFIVDDGGSDGLTMAYWSRAT